MDKLVAVYGTLKKGFRNHHFLENSEYIKSERIKGFDMYDVGDYPGIVKGKGSITVELYKVDQLTESNIDWLEHYQDNTFDLYKKQPIKTSEGTAFIYVYNLDVSNYPLIKSGNYEY